MFDFTNKAKFHKEKILNCLNENVCDSLSTVFLDLVADFCNHKCIFCSGKYSEEFKPTYFSKERLFSMLEEFKSLGVNSIIIVGDGGESTLNPHFEEFIKRAIEYGFHMGLYTNGCSDLDSCIDALCRFDFIRVSLDACNSDVHQKIHGAPEGDFYKAIRFIKLLKEKNYENVGISYIVMNENSQCLDDAIYLAHSLKVKYIEFKPYYLKDYSLSTENSFELLRSIEQTFKDKTLSCKVIFNNQYKQLLENSNEIIVHKEPQCCLSSRLRLVVSPKGCYLCPCYRGKNEFLLGNPQEKSIVDIWYSKEHEALYNYKCGLQCPYYEQNEFLLLLQKSGNMHQIFNDNIVNDNQEQVWFL